MKLTNKVTNAFFGLIAVIGLFMPIVGYQTIINADEFNIVDMINLLKDANLNESATLLGNLEPYGYKTAAICVAVFFCIMLLFLAVSLIISFINVPYLARAITTGIAFGSYVTAVVYFLKISQGFMSGAIPTSAITGLAADGLGSSSILGMLVSSFVSITKMGITSGAFVGMISLGIMFAVNVFFFIFRKKFALEDGEPVKSQKKNKSKKVKSKK